ncbi:sugar phosphate isomerase/epimerase [soil metagenome]
MHVACSTLCFGTQPLDEALRCIREMRFAKADLTLSEDGPHLKPSELASDSGRITQRLKAANLPIAAVHAEFKELDSETTRAELRGVCRLARHLAVPVVSTAAATPETELAHEVARMRGWVRIAEAEGVMLTLETHAKTLTADPAVAAELCRQVPGLGLTLDPSHYTARPAGPQAYEELFPFVKHVRLRDSGRHPEKFQVPVGQGELEYGWIISQLDRFRYDRALSVDVRATHFADFPVEPEVRKLKYLLESMV